jgi:predicted ArsR family transcriptional regulator
MNEKIANEQNESLFQAVKEVHIIYVKQQINLLNALKERYGPEVGQVVEEANSQEICKTFREIAKQTGKNSIKDLINVLWQPLKSKGYKFTMEETDDGFQMNCTACPYVNLYKGLGGENWGFQLYCAADENLVAAFNPEIGFKRTKTLMQGDECCDHFYYYK